MSPAGEPAAGDRPSADELAGRLEPILRLRIPGATDAHITNWRAAQHGVSTETYLFDVQVGDSPTPLRRLVFRRPPATGLYPDYDLLRQVLVMKRLAGTNIPVPTVHWLDRDPAAMGTPYYVMEQLPGIGSPGDFPSYHAAGLYFDATPQQRSAMWWGCIETMVDVHALDWRALGLDSLLLTDDGAHPMAKVVEHCADNLHWAAGGSPRPELVAAVAWLRENVYEPEHLTLCWGDSRMSNVLYDSEFRVTAALDWEVAYIGDPEGDLAWMLFVDWACSEYERTPRLAGTPSAAETVARYEELSGRTVRHLRFNEVLAAIGLAAPVTRLETKLRSSGMVGTDLDLLGFCVERIRQLIG